MSQFSNSSINHNNNNNAHLKVFSTLRIALQTHVQASNIMKCLEVDEELQPTKIEKRFEVQDNILIM
jgi:hypothetical protein